MKTTEAPGRAAARNDTPSDATSAQNGHATLANVIQTLLREFWALVRDHLLLVALDAQRAGRNITRMIFAGIMAAVLLVTAWFALVTSVMCWLVADDPSWGRAFLTLGLIHVGLSAALIAWMRRLGADAMLSATLRQLRTGHETQGTALDADRP
jgi:uncharacterized membrane protein YqjE